MSESRQSRSKYEITQEFTAYSFQWEEEVREDTRTLEKGVIVWADPDFWRDKPWKGKMVVRFLCDNAWFYVDRQTFDISTRRQ